MIFEAIAVVQTANTAIGAVKELLSNGKDITDCAKHLGEYFDAKSQLAKNAGTANSTGSDLENFLHLEKLRQQEEELKELLIWQGRANLYTDFLRYQAEQKHAREEAQKEAKRAKIRKRKETMRMFGVMVVIFVVMLGVAVIGGFIWYLSQMRHA